MPRTPHTPHTIEPGEVPLAPALPSSARLAHLLEVSSRTFALTIPLLPEPTRREVTVAYLLFRVADTLEDATLWSHARKLEELEQYALVLRRTTGERGPSMAGDSVEQAESLALRWGVDPPLRHSGYLELLAALPEVADAAGALPSVALATIRRHTLRTIEGMASFVLREERGALRLVNLDDLRAYCYVVAGIVGEMLTDVFLLNHPGLESSAAALRRDAAVFGEALQLVNILKDSAADSTEGRHYLPDDIPRENVFALAREDLTVAAGYSGRLESEGAPGGVVAFTALPLLLASESLRMIESRGPGSKISRADVTRVFAALQQAIPKRGVSELLNRM